MSTFSLQGGVNEREPTLIGDEQIQDCSGAEYRVGEPGIFVARGRDLLGTITSATGKGLYEAGFDGTSQYVVAHTGNSLHYARISTTLSFTLFDNLPSGSSALVGAHYSNRHYMATGVANRRIEATATGLTSFPIGMSASTFIVGTSVSGVTGSISATTGLVYWVTEYDSARGIESTTGSSVSTGAISGKTSVIVTVTGVSSNSRADKIRWYRSVDGGGYPDGGIVRETAIGTTQIVDSLTQTGSLTVPSYGMIDVGGLDYERDVAPPTLHTIFGPFQDSLLGVASSDLRTLLFTPAGYPDSWPTIYGIPLETKRRDEIVGGVILTGRVGVFCKDSVRVVYRLPRDSDSIFASGEMQEVLTDQRGCVSRRGATTFTPPGGGSLAAFVARDGIWITDLASAPMPLTDFINWDDHVSVANLSECRLTDDPVNRRLIFVHRRAADSSHNTGLWYLDYQQFNEMGVRITFADHGPLADCVTAAASDDSRRAFSIDSRASNGKVYLEATQDVDDSQLVDSSGSVIFNIRTKEFMPAGPRGSVSLGKATWMHDAGPATIKHNFYFNRRDDNPELKTLPESTSRTASDVVLGRDVNTFSLELVSAGTTSYGVHWVDVEGLEVNALGGRGGA